MDYTVRTARETFGEVAAAARGTARVPVELRTTVANPFDAYRRARAGPGGAFLETTGGQPGWGYFGIDPVERLQVTPEAVVRDPNADTGDYRRATPTLEALEGILDGERLARGDCSVPYPCGAIGWLSYDIARELEDLVGEGSDGTDDGTTAVDDRDLPRLQIGVFDRLASWQCPIAEDADADGGAGAASRDTTLYVTACPVVPGDIDDPEADEDRLDALYDDAVARAADLIERIETGAPDVGAAPAPGTEARFESATGREAYADAVRRVKAYVRDGDTFQANVSQRLVAPAVVHPVEAYDALRDVNPAPYSGLLEFGWDGRGVDLVSASPELLLEREPSGEGDERAIHLVTEPIAGTRPRGDTPDADAALEAELTSDEKERAEHAMLVDLERNDLGKVCEFGTVEVAEYRRVDRYSEVMHLVSLVEGEARPDATLADAIAACFPGGTITGAPKPRTMEIIDELERTRRGPYTGSMAVFGFDGRATLNIVIRTLVRHAAEYHLRVGAGIVHDSDPDAEYDETLAKGRALVAAIDQALERNRLSVAEPETVADAAGEER